ncbi:MAG: hypothetical protein JXR76_17940 [Deltaproteobacteria bacterium]|nr:hypothetical protein [Deltaproteobacteria bacterium]
MRYSNYFSVVFLGAALAVFGCQKSSKSGGGDTTTDDTDSWTYASDSGTLPDTLSDSQAGGDTTDTSHDTATSVSSDTNSSADSDTGAVNDSDTTTPPDTDSATTAPDSDSDSDSVPATTACESDADCADNGDLTYCLVNPLPNQQGFCTIGDCEPGDCQAGYACCDCDGVAIPDSIPWDLSEPTCIPAEGSTVLGALGCACDNSGDTDNPQVTACESNADCANNGAMDHCLQISLPTATPINVGCVETGCTPGSCESGYSCCSCGAFASLLSTSEPMCASDAISSQISGFCSCN